MIKEICGETKEIMYDKKIKILNLELVDSNGTPLIIFQDWTKHKKTKDLIYLHIKEAVELKSMIDNLVIDYMENLKEKKEEK